MKTSKTDASTLLLILIGLLVIVGIVFAVTSFRSNLFQETFDESNVINILFVIESERKPLCTYVFMLYPGTKRAAIFDVPGSMGLIIESISRVDRIDRLFDPRRIAPFSREIEKLLGTDIPFSIVITLENLGKLTDLLEGVELFIPSPVDEFQDQYILFPSGRNYLDGDKAKLYISYELPEESEDLPVNRRQRFFIGLIKRLGEKNEFLKNPDAARIFHSLLKTGIREQNQKKLFAEIAGIDTDRISIQTVSGYIRNVSGQDLIFPHWDGNMIKEIVRRTLSGLVQPSESAMGERLFTVEVLNGTSTGGLAGRTAELFRGFGYDVINISNADRNDYDKTLIIDRSGMEDLVRAFADLIRCNNIRYDSPYDFPSDFADLTDADSESPFGTPMNPLADADPGAQNQNYQADLVLILGKDFNGRYVAN